MNISLSNNPVFSEGHFIRVEPLEVICQCGSHCYPLSVVSQMPIILNL